MDTDVRDPSSAPSFSQGVMLDVSRCKMYIIINEDIFVNLSPHFFVIFMFF